ncbi:MAG: Ku protein [Planctomycetota bacterium]|nr:Ku protein [Planctomycetota bacterium]
MPRPIWKGFIAFGLVSVPCDLSSLEAPERDVNFTMLDKRDHERIRYLRVNERSGKEVEWSDIVKGHEVAEGEYVIVTPQDFKNASPKASKTIDIHSFVEASAVPPWYYKRPYLVRPSAHGEKGYRILCDTLKESGRAGLASVVLHTRQHLALLVAHRGVLVLNTLRYESELRGFEDFELPDASDVKVSKGEVEIALKLVDAMTEAWDPSKFHDQYRDALVKWIAQRAKKGTSTPEPAGADEPEDSGPYNIMEMLQRSVESRTHSKPRASPKKAASRRKKAG